MERNESHWSIFFCLVDREGSQKWVCDPLRCSGPHLRYTGNVSETYPSLKDVDYVLTLFSQAFLPFKGRGVFWNPLMISGINKSSPVKLCAVIVLLKAYQNTKRNFRKSDLRRHNDVIDVSYGKTFEGSINHWMDHFRITRNQYLNLKI